MMLPNQTQMTKVRLTVDYRYCPVGRGFLTGKMKSHDDIPEGDYSRMLPKLQAKSLETNMKLVEEVKKLADRKGVLTSQIALGWILGLSGREGMPTIIPIPGSCKSSLRLSLFAPPLESIPYGLTAGVKTNSLD